MVDKLGENPAALHKIECCAAPPAVRRQGRRGPAHYIAARAPINRRHSSAADASQSASPGRNMKVLVSSRAEIPDLEKWVQSWGTRLLGDSRKRRKAQASKRAQKGIKQQNCKKKNGTNQSKGTIFNKPGPPGSYHETKFRGREGNRSTRFLQPWLVYTIHT